MTRDEVKELLMTIKAVYPNFNVKPEEMTPTINAWHLMLEEYPAQAINGALKIYIKTSNTGFAPSVSQLIGSLHAPTQNDQLSEGEAWALVKKAIADGNYNSEAGFEALPPLVQKAVGGSQMIREWAQTPSDEVNTVVMSNFQRTYRAVLSKQDFNNRIPDPLHELVKGLAGKLSGERMIEANE